MRRLTRQILALVVVAIVATLGAACGGEDAGPATSTSAGTTTDPGESRPAPSVVEPTATAPAAGDDVDDQGADDEERAPTPAAIAAGRGLDRLAAAFAPVSDRTSFIVAAETLRADAVDGNAGEKVEEERAGAVRIELKRMEDILAAVRPRVASIAVRTIAQQQVQQLLLEAIDARRRAMAQLRSAVAAEGSGLPDRVVEARFDAWRASWNASLRATREATTTTQDARARLQLEPAPEEALR